MVRWHDSRCQSPAIRLVDNIPSCDSCGSSPPLDRLIAAGREANPTPPIPPDEPPDRMNLRWPPSVDFLLGGAHRESSRENQAPAPFQRGEDPESGSSEATTSLERQNDARMARSSSSTYGPALEPDEFRLLWLPPPPEDGGEGDAVIHCEFETFPLDDCPEYETVSYAWGGEDGDSRRVWPVFVGAYWDVLLQTRNCFDLLRHTRPYRGLRALWVDAICINQDDDVERGRQVANMARIYRDCSRVRVFLGRPAGREVGAASRRTPARKDLRSLISDENILRVRELLSMRYFSRMWIIQELILPKEILVQIDGVEFIWCKDASNSELLSANLWASTAAPWLQYIQQRSPLGMDIVEILSFTSPSAASDLRDKVFAFLGLLRSTQNDRPGHVLAPDYSLSVQQVFIGLFSHLIVGLGKAWLLHKSSGLPLNSDRVLSWIPPWRDFPMDDLLHPEPNLSLEMIHHELIAYQSPGNGSHRDIHNVAWLSAALELPEQSSEWPTRPGFGTGWERLRNKERGHFSRLYAKIGEDESLQAAVHSHTGALIIKAIQLLPIHQAPQLLFTSQRLALLEFNSHHGRMLLATSPEKNVGELVRPNVDMLFVLLLDSSSYLPLILRPEPAVASSSSRTPRWNLVSTCLAVGFDRHWSFGSNTEHLPICNLLCPVSAMLREARRIIMIQFSSALSFVSHPYFSRQPGLKGRLEEVARLYDIALEYVANPSAQNMGTFGDALAALVCPALQARTDGHWLILTFEPSLAEELEMERKESSVRQPDVARAAREERGRRWNFLQRRYSPRDSAEARRDHDVHGWWEIVSEEEPSVDSSQSLQKWMQKFKDGEPLVLRRRLANLVTLLQKDPPETLYQSFKIAKTYHKAGIADLLQNGPAEADFDRHVSLWPKPLMKDLNIIGKQVEVHIV